MKKISIMALCLIILGCQNTNNFNSSSSLCYFSDLATKEKADELIADIMYKFQDKTIKGNRFRLAEEMYEVALLGHPKAIRFQCSLAKRNSQLRGLRFKASTVCLVGLENKVIDKDSLSKSTLSRISNLYSNANATDKKEILRIRARVCSIKKTPA